MSRNRTDSRVRQVSIYNNSSFEYVFCWSDRINQNGRWDLASSRGIVGVNASSSMFVIKRASGGQVIDGTRPTKTKGNYEINQFVVQLAFCFKRTPPEGLVTGGNRKWTPGCWPSLRPHSTGTKPMLTDMITATSSRSVLSLFVHLCLNQFVQNGLD